MIKLQDFARECGVTDRQIQRLLKKYEAELEGLFIRKGKNGTWLTEDACNIIRSKMRTSPVVVGDAEQLREMQQLQERIRLLEERIERKDVLIDQLQQREAAKDKQLAEANTTKLLLEQKQAELDSFKPVGFGFYRKK